jgi:hypothetical protein
MELFCDAVFGPSWKTIVEQAVPGSVEQAVRDVDTFIQEGAAFQEWHFGSTEAASTRQPVLSVLGARSLQFMKEGRALLHSWFPQTEECDVPTTHLLQMQDPKGVALGLSEFFGRHVMAKSTSETSNAMDAHLPITAGVPRDAMRGTQS